MLKRCFSIILVICMMLSLSCSLTYADYSYVKSFEENNMSAKQIVIAKNHAFVASGADDEATDVLNVYNLETRGLVNTYSVPVYETGRDYFVEKMYVVGDYMYISFNRNRGWGDPFIRKYLVDDMIGGTFKHLKTTGIRGDHVTAQFEDKIFYSEPGYRTLDLYSTGTDTSADVMSLSENDRNYLEKELKGMAADADYFYLYTDKEIRAYKTENVYNGLMESYDKPVVLYNHPDVIKGIELYDGKLFVMGEQGLEVLAIEDGEVKSLGKYTQGGEIMAVTPAGNDIYVYAAGAKAIQILDISDLANITLKEEIKANNPETKGIKDIAVEGGRIYAADLTDGFSLYSSIEIDKEQAEVDMAESYAEELAMSSHAKAIELCVGLRIMELRADGLFVPEGYITRAEFAQSAARLLGDKASGTYSMNEFTDVPKDSEYAEGIYGLVNLGILNGYGDGTFRPDEAVSYEHAVLIMTKVLGYYPLIENSERTVFDIAGEIGILKNVSPMANGRISRENVARLISNSLETETLKFAAGINPFKYESSKEETLLYKMGLKKIKGQITATEFISLSGGYTAGKGKIEIGDFEYPEGSSGAGTYIGRNVTAYHRFDDDTEHGELVYVIPSDKDEILTVKAEDILPSTSKTEFKYYDEDRKTESEDIRNSTIIVNGIFDAKFTAADLVPEEGEVTLLDADNDDSIDVVIVKNYKTYVVDGYAKGIFKFKYGKGEIDLNKIDANGGKFSVVIDGYRAKDIKDISGVKEYSILSVLESRNKEVVEIYVTNNTAVGMITGIVNNKSMEIEGVEYKISKSHISNVSKPANNIPDVTAGDEVFAYIDMFGKVAAIKGNNSTLKYGWLIACTRGQGLNTKDVSFKLLADDENELHGSIQRYKAADNLRVNDVKIEDIYTVSELFSETGLKEQVIKFSLNHEGDINNLYTAIDKVNEEISEGVPNPYYDDNYCGYTLDQFTYDDYIAAYSSSMAYRGGDHLTIEGEPFLPTINTKIFVIPNKENPKDSDYKMFDNNTMFKSGGIPSANLKFYDINDDYEIGVIVVQNAQKGICSVTNSSARLVIDSFEKGLNEDGEPVTIVVGCKNASGTRTEIPIADDEIEHTSEDWNKKYLGTKLVDLPRGSVIQYDKNSKGEIGAMRILFIPTETKSYFETQDGSGNLDYKVSLLFYTTYAKVIKVTGGRIIFNAAGMGEDGDIANAKRVWDRNLRASDAEVYLYDSDTDKLTPFDLGSILPGDDIFLVKRSVYVEQVIVYR